MRVGLIVAVLLVSRAAAAEGVPEWAQRLLGRWSCTGLELESKKATANALELAYDAQRGAIVLHAAHSLDGLAAQAAPQAQPARAAQAPPAPVEEEFWTLLPDGFTLTSYDKRDGTRTTASSKGWFEGNFIWHGEISSDGGPIKYRELYTLNGNGELIHEFHYLQHSQVKRGLDYGFKMALTESCRRVSAQETHQ